MPKAQDPQKRIGSKWTAMAPQHREKHFELIGVEKSGSSQSHKYLLRSILSGKVYPVEAEVLQDLNRWHKGWL